MIQESCPRHPEKMVQWHCAQCRRTLCETCRADLIQGKITCAECIFAGVPAGPSTDRKARGIGLGIGLSFLLNFMPMLISWPLYMIFRGRGEPGLMNMLFGIINFPLLWITVGYVVARAKGYPKVAKGILIGLLIQIGLIILLVTACFGLIAIVSR